MIKLSFNGNFVMSYVCSFPFCLDDSSPVYHVNRMRTCSQTLGSSCSVCVCIRARAVTCAVSNVCRVTGNRV
jgi:hypothetical protein